MVNDEGCGVIGELAFTGFIPENPIPTINTPIAIVRLKVISGFSPN
jgi:hypothetical protein